MGWIRERILSENKKHYRVTGGLDWARLAEDKILLSLGERIGKINKYNAIEEDDCILTKDLMDVFVLTDESGGKNE